MKNVNFPNCLLVLAFTVLINWSFKVQTNGQSDCQLLLDAVKNGQLKQVNHLLKTTQPNCIFYGNGEPRTPLVAAARRGDVHIAKALIDAGAEIDFHASGDESPLMAASKNGHLSLADYFIQQDAQINLAIVGDGTALICAVRGGHYEVAKLLLENGADPNQSVKGDEYPMYHAKNRSNRKLIKLLKKYEGR